MNKNIIYGIAGVIIGVIATLLLNGGMGGTGGTTNFDTISLSEGLSVTGATTLSSTLSAAATTLSGLLTTNTGTLRSYTNATTSVGSGTLQVSDVNGYDTVLLTPTGAAATKTLTFFASSTATTWLPTAGDMQETCFYNGTTTAATTITFAAGTGIDLETASSSPTDLILLAGNTACFKFMRQSSTASTFDISALMTEYTNGD